MSVIPNSEQHMRDGSNVLVSAPHGVGKTFSVEASAKAVGHRVQYFSCPTLDPYTDLTGVPVPKVDDDGNSYLELVRPKTVLDADGIFFDEFNRAHPKILNAVMEIIQFRRINGVYLPNLKWCWAAINPPGSEYEVEELDVAIVDRFDFFYDVTPTVDVNYLKGVGVRPEIAQVFARWWNRAFGTTSTSGASKRDMTNYISPRRVEKMATFYEDSRNRSMLTAMIPPGVKVEIAALLQEIVTAEARIAATAQNKPEYFNRIGANSDWVNRDFNEIRQTKDQLLSFVMANPNDLYTQFDVLAKIANGRIGVENMVHEFAAVINSMSGSAIEGFYWELSDSKRRSFKALMLTATNKSLYPNIVKEISGLTSVKPASAVTLDSMKKAQVTTPSPSGNKGAVIDPSKMALRNSIAERARAKMPIDTNNLI